MDTFDVMIFHPNFSSEFGACFLQSFFPFRALGFLQGSVSRSRSPAGLRFALSVSCMFSSRVALLVFCRILPVSRSLFPAMVSSRAALGRDVWRRSLGAGLKITVFASRWFLRFRI